MAKQKSDDTKVLGIVGSLTASPLIGYLCGIGIAKLIIHLNPVLNDAKLANGLNVNTALANQCWQTGIMAAVLAAVISLFISNRLAQNVLGLLVGVGIGYLYARAKLSGWAFQEMPGKPAIKDFGTTLQMILMGVGAVASEFAIRVYPVLTGKKKKKEDPQN
jgi:uncharacterized protein YneF (UPF0154 family)